MRNKSIVKYALLIACLMTLRVISAASAAEESDEMISVEPFSEDVKAMSQDTSKLVFASISNSGSLNAPSLDNTNWMSAIPDSYYLNQITIPGAHDAGCSKVWTKNLIGMLDPDYTITQDRQISEQLEAGVRLLDLRWTNCYKNHISNAKPKALFLCHGDSILFYCENDRGLVRAFETVMNDICGFLLEHPTETVLIDVTSEYDDEDSEWRVYPTLTEKLTQYADNDWLFTENRIPTLGEVRGKMVLISSRASSLGFGIQLASSNGTGSFSVGDIDFEYENHYDLSTSDKLDAISNFYRNAQEGSYFY